MAEGRLRGLLGDVVVAGQRGAGDVVGVLGPDGRYVVVAADEAVLAPERQQRLGEPASGRRVLLVVDEVDRAGRAVVLAGGVDRAGSEKQRTYSAWASGSKGVPPWCRAPIRARIQNSGSPPIRCSGRPLPAVRKNQW